MNLLRVAFGLCLSLLGAHAVELHVSSTAAPDGDGSAQKPFQQIAQARDAARQIQDAPVDIIIHAGHYMERHGLTLEKQDSGEPHRRIVYRAAPNAMVRISSGVQVPTQALQPVTDRDVRARLRPEVRDKVRQLSLGNLGIQAPRFKDRFEGLELLELLWDGKRLPLSRWPDNGAYAKIAKVLDNGLTPANKGTFVFREEAPTRWQSALNEGIWLRGFWRVPWEISAVRAAAIDSQKKTITLAVPVPRGIGSKYHRASGDGVGPGSGEEPWQAINLLEEISQPGEWAVRFSNQTLYILPPAGTGELLISDNVNPVISLQEVSHVSLERLVVNCGLGDGIKVRGGENVLVAGCKASNFSRNAIVLQGGKNHMILSCDTAETGFSGIAYTGGERRTLTPGGHLILNNIVTRAGLYFPRPGIDGGLVTKAEAVGNLIAHNRIHDCMNSGIVYGGNDNTFEYNEIYRIGLGSSDLGCFYTTGGWTSRGNVVRYNFVHHSMNANAFYVDDGDCGDTFLGNIAYKTASGGFIGGGSDHVFRNNIFVENTRAMHVDARGIPRKYTPEDKRLRSDLDSVPYTQPPWSVRYPELVHILENHPERPSRILIESNLFVRCATDVRRSGKAEELTGVTCRNNNIISDLGIFANPEELDFNLKPDAPVIKEAPGIEQIPFSRIGVQPDAYRTTVPPRDMELLRTANTERGFDSQTDIDASNRPKTAQ